jgi:hypothetical protein
MIANDFESNGVPGDVMISEVTKSWLEKDEEFME